MSITPFFIDKKHPWGLSLVVALFNTSLFDTTIEIPNDFQPPI